MFLTHDLDDWRAGSRPLSADSSYLAAFRRLNRPAELAALQAGAWPPIAEIFHIKALLESILAPYADLAMSKDLGFQVGYASNLPSSVRGDSISLERLLTELVMNAVDHTATGTIYLLVRHYRSHGDCLELTVADTGPGLSIVRQLQLTTASPLDSATQGLGLALIRHYIAHLQGELTVQSQEALGTIITCTFPITVVEEGNQSVQKRFFIITRTALPWRQPARRLPSVWTTLVQGVALRTASWPRGAAKTAPTAAPRPTMAPQSPGPLRVSEPSVAAGLKIHSANRGARHFNGQRLAGATQSNGYPLRWTVAGWLAPPLRSLARPTAPAVVDSLLTRDPSSIYVTTLFIRRIDMQPWFNARSATIPQGAIAGAAQDNPPVTTDDHVLLAQSQRPSDPSTEGAGTVLAFFSQEDYSKGIFSSRSGLLLRSDQAYFDWWEGESLRYDVLAVCENCHSTNKERDHGFIEFHSDVLAEADYGDLVFFRMSPLCEGKVECLKKDRDGLVDCLYTSQCALARQAVVDLLLLLANNNPSTRNDIIKVFIESLDNPNEQDYAVTQATTRNLLILLGFNEEASMNNLTTIFNEKGLKLSVRMLAKICRIGSCSTYWSHCLSNTVAELIETLMAQTEPAKEDIETIQTMFNDLSDPGFERTRWGLRLENRLRAEILKDLRELLDRYNKDTNFDNCSNIVERLREFSIAVQDQSTEDLSKVKVSI